MYEFWTRQWYGVNPQTGAELYWARNTTPSTAMVLKNGDTVTTTTANAKYAYSGSAIPDFYGSRFAFQTLSHTFLQDYK